MALNFLRVWHLLSDDIDKDCYYRHVIDTMQSVCLKEVGVTVSGSLEEETTLIGLTFGGCLRSKVILSLFGVDRCFKIWHIKNNSFFYNIIH